MPEISLAVAFGAGLLSFLSPCVLSVAPVYIASLYGHEVYKTGSSGIRLPLLFHSFSFVIGFSAVFIVFGTIAGLTGYAINPDSVWLSKVAGSLLVVFGMAILAALKIPWLNFERRLSPSLGDTAGYMRSFVIGAAFSLGWTPCVAPILGGILTLASVQSTAWQGAYLLAIYSIGLGLPFLVLGVAFDSLAPLLKRIRRYSIVISVISGVILIAVGILLLTNRQTWLYLPA